MKYEQNIFYSFLLGGNPALDLSAEMDLVLDPLGVWGVPWDVRNSASYEPLRVRVAPTTRKPLFLKRFIGKNGSVLKVPQINGGSERITGIPK